MIVEMHLARIMVQDQWSSQKFGWRVKEEGSDGPPPGVGLDPAVKKY